MKYLNKETNGITLSRIGLGAMRMADVQQGVDTIHAALDKIGRASCRERV